MRGRPDIETVAEGEAEFRRGGGAQRRLAALPALTTSRWRAATCASAATATFTADELQLQVAALRGLLPAAELPLGRTGVGGTAGASTSSMSSVRWPPAPPTPAARVTAAAGSRLLSTDKVKMDFEANEGIAENACCASGVPSWRWCSASAHRRAQVGLAAPDQHRQQERSAVPPLLEHRAEPRCDVDAAAVGQARRRRRGGVPLPRTELPGRGAGARAANDQLTGRARHALNLNHGDAASGRQFTFNGLRVSDDSWKDFSRAPCPASRRACCWPSAAVRRDFDGWSSYARVHRWQVLRDDSALIIGRRTNARHRRSACAVRSASATASSSRSRPSRTASPIRNQTARRPAGHGRSARTGVRWHRAGQLAWPSLAPGR